MIQELMNGMSKSGVVVIETDTARKLLLFMESVKFTLSDPPEIWDVAREVFEKLSSAVEMSNGPS